MRGSMAERVKASRVISLTWWFLEKVSPFLAASKFEGIRLIDGQRSHWFLLCS